MKFIQLHIPKSGLAIEDVLNFEWPSKDVLKVSSMNYRNALMVASWKPEEPFENLALWLHIFCDVLKWEHLSERSLSQV